MVGTKRGFKARIAVFTSVIVVPLVITSVAGANQFGLRYWNPSTEYGNISSIAVPTASNQPANAYAMYLHRSVIQPSGANGIAQSGWATLGVHVALDMCGTTSGATKAFVETLPAGSSTYTCSYDGTYTPPTDINFNVYTGSAGVWSVKIGGVADPNSPYSLGFTTGAAEVGGESFIASGGSGPVASTCFGNGASAWDFYAAFNSGGGATTRVTPNSSTSTTLTGGWSIDPAPSPLCDSI